VDIESSVLLAQDRCRRIRRQPVPRKPHL